MKFALCFLAVAVASSFTEANVISDVVDKAKEEFEHLKNVVNLIIEGKSTDDIIKAIVQDHPKLQKPLDHLKAIHDQLEQGKTPQQIIQNEVNSNDQVKHLVDFVCTSKFLNTIQFVSTSCNFLGENGKAPAQRSLSFDNFVNGFNHFVNTVDLSGALTDGINNIKNLVQVVQAHKSPAEIAQAVLDMNLQNAASLACKDDVLKQNYTGLAQACRLIEPATGLISKVSGQVSAALGPAHQRKFTFGDFVNGFDHFVSNVNIGGAISDTLNNVNNLVQVIQAHKSPADIAKAVLDLNLQNTAALACKDDTLKQNYSGLADACRLIQPAAGLISQVTGQVSGALGAHQRRRRSFDDFVNGFNHFVNTVDLSGAITDSVTNIKNLVNVIQAHKSPEEIAQAVLQLNLQNTAALACKDDTLKQNYSGLAKACGLIEPAAGLISKVSGQVSGALGPAHQRKFTFGDFVNGFDHFVNNVNIGGAISDTLNNVNNLVQVVQAHKSPAEIAKAVLDLNLQNTAALACKDDTLKQNYTGLADACRLIQPAAGLISKVTGQVSGALARKRRSFDDFVNGFNHFVNTVDLSGAITDSVTNIKNLVNVIQAHKSPEEIAQAVLQLNLQNTAALACKDDTLKQNYSGLAKACGLIEPAAGLISHVSGQVAGALGGAHQRKFSFGDFLHGAENVLSHVPILGDKIDKVKNLVEAIKDKKDPNTIVQAVLGLGLQNDIGSLCQTGALSVVPGGNEACGVITPLTGLISQASGSGGSGSNPLGLLGSLIPGLHLRKFTFGNFVQGFEDFVSHVNVGQVMSNTFQNIGHLVDAIKDKKPPMEIAQAALQINPQQLATLPCQVDAFKDNQGLNNYCKLAEPLAGVISHVTGAIAPNPAQRSFTFQNFVDGASKFFSTVDVGHELSSTFNGINNLVNVIQGKGNPAQIAQAVLQLNPQNLATLPCQVQSFKNNSGLNAYCNFAEPLANMVTHVTGAIAPAQRKFHSHHDKPHHGVDYTTIPWDESPPIPILWEGLPPVDDNSTTPPTPVDAPQGTNETVVATPAPASA